ncbi:MAG: Wzz/FepE/Etk N-terminal domain-containing protein [Candidatus Acidiferrales bacterium]
MLDEMQEPKMRGAEDYWAMLRRQRWVILAAAFVCWLLVWGVSWLLPSSYESDAVILVQQQQVSPNLVAPSIDVSLEAQLESIRQQVLSRTRLQPIIDTYHLYPRQHGVMAFLDPSDPVDQMSTKDIQIKLVEAPSQKNNQETLTAFDISYSAPTAELAQSVNAKLTELFVQEHAATQQQFSQTTTTFLKTELDDARADLDQQDAKVKAFKTQHEGELPDQLQANLQVLSGLQDELQNNERALSGAEQQRLYLQSIVQQYNSVQSDLGNTGDSTVAPETLDKQLKDLEMELAQERSQYTDNYPDVIALKDQIAKTKELQKQTQEEITSQKKPDKGSDALPPGSAVELENGAPTQMMQIQSQLKANQLQIQGLEGAQKRIESQIATYQARLNATPLVEQQLDEISRGYVESSKNYDVLQQKLQESELSSNLQQNQQGEQFGIVSPPSLPTAPSAPNHLLISLGGLGAGIMIGLGLGLLFEFTHVRIYKESDLEGVVSARVLVGIPKLSTAVEKRRRIILRWVERGAVLAMVVIVVAGNIYSFVKG